MVRWQLAEVMSVTESDRTPGDRSQGAVTLDSTGTERVFHAGRLPPMPIRKLPEPTDFFNAAMAVIEFVDRDVSAKGAGDRARIAAESADEEAAAA